MKVLCYLGLAVCFIQSSWASIVDDNHTQLSWELTLKAECNESVSISECTSAHGFSIDSNGNYKLGPTDLGEVRAGTLTPNEFESIKGAITQVLNSGLIQKVNHIRLEPSEVKSSVLKLNQYGTGESVIVRTLGSDFFYTTPTAEDAMTLMMTMTALSGKYYVLPFPDECTQMVESSRESSS